MGGAEGAQMGGEKKGENWRPQAAIIIYMWPQAAPIIITGMRSLVAS